MERPSDGPVQPRAGLRRAVVLAWAQWAGSLHRIPRRVNSADPVGQISRSTAARRVAATIGVVGALTAALLVPSPAAAADSGAVAWGLNNEGQVGDGTTTDRDTPRPVTLPNGGQIEVISVDGGDRHSIALAPDHRTIYTWGSNSNGQLGDGTTTDSLYPVKVELPLAPGATVNSISAGNSHSLASTTDGQVWAWGRNSSGQLGDGTTTDRHKPVRVLQTASMTVVSGGGAHSLALGQGGRGVYAWGSNQFGQLGDGTATDRRRPVAVDVPGLDSQYLDPTHLLVKAGDSHSVLLTRVLDITPPDIMGTRYWEVHTWGWNHYGQLGIGSYTNQHTPTPVFDYICCGVGPQPTISAGYHHTLISYMGGEPHSAPGIDNHKMQVKSWGLNNMGQLGDGTTTTRPSPVTTVSLPDGIHAVAAGGYHSLAAVASTGQLYAWGANDYGQLGDGTTTDRSAPVRITAPLPNNLVFDAGGDHTIHG